MVDQENLEIRPLVLLLQIVEHHVVELALRFAMAVKRRRIPAA